MVARESLLELIGSFSMSSGTSFPCKFRHLLFVLEICSLVATGSAQTAGNSTCPVSFDYLGRFPSTLASCDQTNLQTNITVCCSALINTLGIALAEYLNNTGYFEFKDNATATACLVDFQAGLSANGVRQSFLNTCFPYPYGSPSRFIQHPDLCAGITTTDDWSEKVGQTPMDSLCAGDLSRGVDCQSCVLAAEDVVKKLKGLAPGRVDCLYFTVLYAAGKINVFGPGEPATVECLLGINSQPLSSKSTRTIKVVIVVLVSASVLFIVIFIVTLGVIWKLQSSNRQMHRFLLSELGAYESGSRLNPNRGLVVFKAKDLKAATKNFSADNLIGEGATGRVYRGVLRGRGEVAVKIMKPGCVQDLFDNDDDKFLEQMKVMNSVRHKTLVQLRGCAINDTKQELLLQDRVMVVYDFMPNGNLEQALYVNDAGRTLSWPQRRKMAVDIATAINYLHNELQPGIVHRDIKPSNILLDANFNARLADFGLAKLAAAEPETLRHSLAAGTPLFVAPEYALYGHLTVQSDVYGFGMVLLLLLSGRKPLFHWPESDVQVHVAEWAWKMFSTGRSLEVIEQGVRDSGPASVMKRFVVVGLLCAHPMVGLRPGIGQALAMLEGDSDVPANLPERPSFCQNW